VFNLKFGESIGWRTMRDPEKRAAAIARLQKEKMQQTEPPKPMDKWDEYQKKAITTDSFGGKGDFLSIAFTALKTIEDGNNIQHKNN